MKIFLTGWCLDNFDGLMLEMKKQGVDIVYWIDDLSRPGYLAMKKEFPETIWHDIFSAIRCLPAPDIKEQELDLPSEEIFNRLSKDEAQVLLMMNRIDYKAAPVGKKLDFYHRYVCYWYGVLKKFQPEAIVFSNTPHLVYDYVLYSLAKAMGIKTPMLETVRVGSRVLAMDDIAEVSQEVEKELNALSENKKLADLPSDMQEYWQRHNNPKIDTSPFYVKKDGRGGGVSRWLPVPSLSKLLKSIVNLSIFSKVARYIKNVILLKPRLTMLEGSFSGPVFKWKMWQWNKQVASFKKEYHQLSKPVDLKKRFIYVPLQTQPEKSTSPQGGRFVNQILMVKILSACLPSGWSLYVKEHGNQWRSFTTHCHQGRYPGYYQELAAIPGVELVPLSVSTYDLINHCQAVATTTSTAGWEALLRGVPAVIFGYPWYLNCPAVLRVQDAAGCREALGKIERGYKPASADIFNFLYCIDKVSVPGYSEQRYQQVASVSPEDNIKNIARLVLARLKS